MNFSVLVINPDNCYINDNCNHFDINKYLGLVVYRQYLWVWLNNKYQNIIDIPERILNEKKIFYVHSHKDVIPDDTEILLYNIFYFVKHRLKLPIGLKVLCCFYSSIDIIISELNLPIGLKYLCLNEDVKSEIINKIKVPFGCKIILC
jgi:hypothetical protein